MVCCDCRHGICKLKNMYVFTSKLFIACIRRILWLLWLFYAPSLKFMIINPATLQSLYDLILKRTSQESKEDA